MKDNANFWKTYAWPIIFGVAFSALAFQWAFILDPWGRTFNREVISALCLAWMILFAISLVQKRRKSSVAWLATPGIYVLVIFLCRLSVAGQIEEARLRGEGIVNRAVQYSEVKGTFPKTFADLVAFDGEPIPNTGIAILGAEERKFYLGSSPGTSNAYDAYEGDQFYFESPYRTEFWIGFREYGFQEHKLRPKAEWDTDSGQGDYLVGRIKLRW